MRPTFTLFFLLLSTFWTGAHAQTNDECDIDLGPDVTVCNNATFTLNLNGNPDATYTWTGPAGLSCYNCPSPVVSGLTTGVYSFSATQQTAQCTKTDNITITVIAGQQPQYNIIDDKTICQGTSVMLGGPLIQGTFYQWTSAPPGLLSSSANPTVTPNVTTRYYVIAFNAGCPYVSLDSVLITVVHPPVLDVQTDTAICNGASVLLGHTDPEPGVVYAWTPNDGSLDSADIANPLATPLQTTQYKLVATKSVCMQMRTVQISIVNLDLSLSSGDSARICRGAELPIQATLTPSGGNVSWAPLDGLQIIGNGLNVIASPLSSTLYTATASVPGCKRDVGVYVTVDSIPANLAIQPSDTTICSGATVLLVSPAFQQADYPDISYQWFPPDGQLTPDSLYIMAVQPINTTTYFRVTTNGGCVDTASATVKVVEPPQISVVPQDTLICPGTSVQLNATYPFGIINLSWSPTQNLSCTQCDNPVATPSDSTIYTVTGQFQGCPVSASATVNIRPLPVIQFPDDKNICLGESVVLNEGFDPSATYNWTSTDPDFVPTSTPQPVVSPKQTTTYFVKADNGCVSDKQVTIVVSSATLAVSNDTSICKNFNANLIATGSAPGTYEWSDGQSGASVLVSPAQTTTYTVTYTYGDGCILTDNITVTIQGVGPAIEFPADNELCAGESVVLNSIDTPGATYSWVSNPPGFTSTEAVPPAVTPAQTTQYTITASLDNCTTTETVNIIVYNATLTLPPDITICRGEPLELVANGSLSGEYLWSTGDTTAIIEPMPTQNTTYELTYIYGDGCVLEDEVKVSVKDNFSLKIISDPDTNRVNVGDPLNLMGIIAPSQNLSGFQFQWLENGQTNIGNTESIDVAPSTNDSTITYTLIAVAPNGCTQQEQVIITVVQPLAIIPNAFTPNRDGVNDVFRLKLLQGAAVVLSMEIYDRWGKLVFESVDPAPEWDGNIDGKEAASDVYVYVIRWQRSDGALQPPKIGSIALLR